MNFCLHLHLCCECGKPYVCDFPECMELTGYQRVCEKCSYHFGWKQRLDRASNDWSSL